MSRYDCYETNTTSISRLLKYMKMSLELIREDGAKCRSHDILLCVDANNKHYLISKINGKNTKNSIGKTREIVMGREKLAELKIIAVIKCEDGVIKNIFASDEVKQFIDKNYHNVTKTFMINY